MAKGVELGQPCAALCARAPLHNPGHLEQLLKMLVAEVGPCMLLDPGPGLHIIGINEAYAKATMTAPADLRGQCLFDVFPDNPDDPLANGVANLYSSLTIAARHTEPHARALLAPHQYAPLRRQWRSACARTISLPTRPGVSHLPLSGSSGA